MPMRDEGLITFARIKELEESPVVGRFDVAHLCEIHRRIFQDLPHHAPGRFRPAAPQHVKARTLETSSWRYYVPYARRQDLESGLTRTLAGLSLDDFRDVPLPVFAARMADLYAQLDYWHPFAEGNSRTLRTFTRQLAAHAGIQLDWTPSGATPALRDQLYIARDFAVFAQAFPDLSEARAMATENRVEYEAWLWMERFQDAPRLPTLILASSQFLAERAYHPAPERDDEWER